MNKEAKRTVLIISLTAGAFLTAIMPFLEIMFIISEKDNIPRFFDGLNKIEFFHWSCFVVFGLAGYALIEVWVWKIASGCLYPKVIAIFFILMALLLAALWFFIAVMFEVPA